MADGIYVGMSAAVARAAQLDSVADNLANVETPGFKASRPAFRSFLPPAPSDKVLAGAVSSGVDLRPGTTSSTDDPLDVLPDNGLYLGVKLSTGQPAYTRNGHLEVNAAGQLLISGLPVLGASGQPIVVPDAESTRIDTNGNVMSGKAVVDSLALFNVQGPMDRVAPWLLSPSAGSTVTQAQGGTVRVGELELGNANALDATVQMINAQRQFETAMQAIQTYRRLDERATEVGRVR